MAAGRSVFVFVCRLYACPSLFFPNFFHPAAAFFFVIHLNFVALFLLFFFLFWSFRFLSLFFCFFFLFVVTAYCNSVPAVCKMCGTIKFVADRGEKKQRQLHGFSACV